VTYPVATGEAVFEELFARQPRVEFDVELSPERIDAFWAQGFTSIERITTDEELEWLGQVYDALFEGRVAVVPGGYFDLARPYESQGEDLLPQILVPESRFKELRDTTLFRNGRRLAAQLFGVPEDELKGWGHMIRKPPLVGEALPWHQDEAYWDPALEYRALGVWVPLDPATVDSGCMRFIPGSHRGDVRLHSHLNDDPNTHALLTEDVDESLAVPVPVDPGGATFHHCRLVHSSGPNRSQHVRRAYVNEFQREPVPRAIPIERPWIDEGREAWAKRSL
jgi:hypothetical protein